MEKTFNMGVGMVAVVARGPDRAMAILTARHLNCWTLGSVAKGKDAPRVKLEGRHPRF